MMIPEGFDKANKEYRNKLMESCGCDCHSDKWDFITEMIPCCAYSGRKIEKQDGV
jgi:hypothetical protein